MEGGREEGKDGGEATVGQQAMSVHREPKLVKESPGQGGGIEDGREEEEEKGEGEEKGWMFGVGEKEGGNE